MAEEIFFVCWVGLTFLLRALTSDAVMANCCSLGSLRRLCHWLRCRGRSLSGARSCRGLYIRRGRGWALGAGGCCARVSCSTWAERSLSLPWSLRVPRTAKLCTTTWSLHTPYFSCLLHRHSIRQQPTHKRDPLQIEQFSRLQLPFLEKLIAFNFLSIVLHLYLYCSETIILWIVLYSFIFI